jgi:site-specific recombinase XerD
MRLPAVLAPQAGKKIFSRPLGAYRLMAGVIYGGDLRLQERLILRVKDLDFNRNCILIKPGKGDKERQPLLAENLAEDLRKHMESIEEIHREDRKNRIEWV